MTLEQVVQTHLLAAIETHEQVGLVTSKLWSTGAEGAHYAIAEAASRGTITADESERVELLDLMCRAIAGDVVGRVDEAFVRWRPDGEPLEAFAPGDLARRADTDPLIRTALVVQGMDWVTGRYHGALAVADLDDEGAPLWVHATLDTPSDSSVMVLTRAAMRLAQEPEPDVDDARVMLCGYADAAGWAILYGSFDESTDYDD